MKAIRPASVEGHQWKRHLYRYLLYRATPHTTTELVYHWKIQTKLPQPQSITVLSDTVLKQKRKWKHMLTKEHRHPKSKLVISYLCVNGNRINSTWYNPYPFCVTRIKGTMVTARRKDKYITRNSSHFKVIYGSMEGTDESSDEEKIGDNTPPAATSGTKPEWRYLLRNWKSSRHFGNNINCDEQKHLCVPFFSSEEKERSSVHRTSMHCTCVCVCVCVCVIWSQTSSFDPFSVPIRLIICTFFFFFFFWGGGGGVWGAEANV